MLTDLLQAELALKSDETPVGCVFVHDGKVIARGMNGTNISMNVSHCLLPPTQNIHSLNTNASRVLLVSQDTQGQLLCVCLVA